MRSKENYGGLDGFRLAAALLVIAIHTSPLTSVSADADFFLTRILARVAVPFFLMVTGQFVAARFQDGGGAAGGRDNPGNRDSTLVLGRYLRKMLLLYLAGILLYLPIGIYAGHYKDLTIGRVLRMLVFDGTFYHLWYFPACITGMLLVYLMSRALKFQGMFAVSVLLYLIGLLGDSYFGLAEMLPPLKSVYEFAFQIFSYTRNGLFLAPLFLVLGMRMGKGGFLEKYKGNPRLYLTINLTGLTVSFLMMTGEAFCLRHFEFQRHDSMYLLLVSVMIFLYQSLLCLPARPQKLLRSAALWIYVLHPAFIVVVRGIAKVLKMTALLVDNSIIHYLAVTVLSLGAGFCLAILQSRLSRRRAKDSLPQEGEAGSHELVPQERNDLAEILEGYRAVMHSWISERDRDIEYSQEVDADIDTDPGRDNENAGDASQVLSDGNARQIRSAKDMPQVLPDGNARQVRSAGHTPQVQPTGRAWIQLDMKALAENVAFLRSLLPEGCRLMPAVKADAYGHGAVPIARELNRLGVDAFCVATIAEGISLRRAGIQGEILILGYTPPEDLPLLVRWQLAQSVVDYPYAEQLARSGLKLHVHVAIDTGMHRLGIRCENIEDIAAVFEMGNLSIDGMFSHFSASDSPDDVSRAFTKAQADAFYQVVEILEAQGFPRPKLHLQASYGLLNYAHLESDYVRAGIALYGVHSCAENASISRHKLSPVLSLMTRVISVRMLYAGDSAGYGMDFTADRDMKLAVLSIGYADGLPRELSGGRGYVLIHGHKAPVIGRICMDLTLADISKIPQTQVGDIAVVIGRSDRAEITAEEIASQCGTITNELLSRLGPRLERVIT